MDDSEISTSQNNINNGAFSQQRSASVVGSAEVINNTLSSAHKSLK